MAESIATKEKAPYLGAFIYLFWVTNRYPLFVDFTGVYRLILQKSCKNYMLFFFFHKKPDYCFFIRNRFFKLSYF